MSGPRTLPLTSEALLPPSCPPPPAPRRACSGPSVPASSPVSPAQTLPLLPGRPADAVRDPCVSPRSQAARASGAVSARRARGESVREGAEKARDDESEAWRGARRGSRALVCACMLAADYYSLPLLCFLFVSPLGWRLCPPSWSGARSTRWDPVPAARAALFHTHITGHSAGSFCDSDSGDCFSPLPPRTPALRSAVRLAALDMTAPVRLASRAGSVLFFRNAKRFLTAGSHFRRWRGRA